MHQEEHLSAKKLFNAEVYVKAMQKKLFIVSFINLFSTLWFLFAFFSDTKLKIYLCFGRTNKCKNKTSDEASYQKNL